MTPARERVRRLAPGDAASVADLLIRDFRPDAASHSSGGDGLTEGAVAHHFLLDALDRGQYERFWLWPGDDPVALLFSGTSGTLVPAGDPAAAAPLAEAADGLGWRVLVGDAPLGWALLEAGGQVGLGLGRNLFRRRVNVREQRFMAIRAGDVDDVDALAPGRPTPEGFRLARTGDLDVLVEQACRLHVEDQMGPPIARTARGSVRQRLSESVARGHTWVVERDGRPIAKADLSLRSPRRGAQIAGVYVDAQARGQGVGGALVAELVRALLRDGSPAVSLHVRSDNTSAIAAYSQAGLSDRRGWVLGLR